MEVALESGWSRLSPAAARAFQRRWQEVNKAERQELQATPLIRKLEHLDALLTSIPVLEYDREGREAEKESVRQVWAKLRQNYQSKASDL